MKKSEARQLVEAGITWGEIQQVLIDARNAGQADERRSSLNKSMTKAVAFNIFWRAIKDKDPSKRVEGIGSGIAATNVLREFNKGSKGSSKKQLPKPYHEEPIDIDGNTERKVKNGILK